MLRSSYWWLLIVPVCAKALAKLPDTLTLTVFGAKLELSLTLPFHWALLYFSAFLIAIATALYSLRCPLAIRKSKSFAHWRSEGNHPDELCTYFLEWLISSCKSSKGVTSFLFGHNRKLFIGQCKQYLKKSLPQSGTSMSAIQQSILSMKEIEKAVDLLPESGPLVFDKLVLFLQYTPQSIPEHRVIDVYWHIIGLSDDMHPLSRTTIALSYLIGLGLIAYILLVNTLFVVNAV